MNCAMIDDCPRANCVGCKECTDCEQFITPGHYELLKNADTTFFRGFMLGIVFSVVVVAILVLSKGVIE